MHIIFDVLWLDYMLHKHTSHNGSFRYALKLHGSEFLRTNVIWAGEHIERVLKWSFELKSKRNEPYSLANNWEKSRIECYSFHSFRGIGKLVFCFSLILSHFFLLRLLITEMKTTNRIIRYYTCNCLTLLRTAEARTAQTKGDKERGRGRE